MVALQQQCMVAFNPQWNDKIYSIINYSSSSRFYICFMAQKKKLITCCYASYHMLQIYELQSSCSQYRIFTSFLAFGPHKSTLIHLCGHKPFSMSAAGDWVSVKKAPEQHTVEVLYAKQLGPNCSPFLAVWADMYCSGRVDTSSSDILSNSASRL